MHKKKAGRIHIPMMVFTGNFPLSQITDFDNGFSVNQTLSVPVFTVFTGGMKIETS